MNSLKNKIPDVTTIIHIQQYNEDKNLEKKIGDVDVKKSLTLLI